ncbi:MAG TPA: cytochrome P460 family protein [Tepidisphaeraceae bacterium]|nr:cytochrome P460 family protein [Tepidisphaeraceae bacterium]
MSGKLIASESIAMRIPTYIFASILLAGCAPSDETAKSANTAPAQPEVQQVASKYQSLRRMTKKPVLVDAGLAMLCRGISQSDVDAARQVSGPHAHTRVSIFMNDAAADTFGKPNATYPVGSIVIKEKRAMEYLTSNQPNQKVKANDGVGGMIKRSPGYDPDHGDWEYFYFESPDKIESGKMNSCIQCHSGAAKKDYIFGDWAAGGE